MTDASLTHKKGKYSQKAATMSCRYEACRKHVLQLCLVTDTHNHVFLADIHSSHHRLWALPHQVPLRCARYARWLVTWTLELASQALLWGAVLTVKKKLNYSVWGIIKAVF